jgi:hypothetical protein
MKKIINLFFCVFLVSCEINDCSYINGVWAINKNSGWFQGSYFFERDPEVKWYLIKNNSGLLDSIRIESKIKIYNDTFKINLNEVEKTGQVHIELKSKNVYISAFKIIKGYK